QDLNPDRTCSSMSRRPSGHSIEFHSHFSQQMLARSGFDLRLPGGSGAIPLRTRDCAILSSILPHRARNSLYSFSELECVHHAPSGEPDGTTTPRVSPRRQPRRQHHLCRSSSWSFAAGSLPSDSGSRGRSLLRTVHPERSAYCTHGTGSTLPYRGGA